jgi:hypothetical protein
VIVSINQPAYLPWLGYFHRIAISDLHVVLDHVQFEKNSFTNRNKVRTPSGHAWLTVPVRTKGRFGDLAINEVEVADDGRWAGKHLATLEQSYRRAPHLDEHHAFLRDVYGGQWARLAELAGEITTHHLQAFGIDTKLVSSVDLAVPGRKAELVLNLCREVGATVYLSGPLGRDYLDEGSFEAAGIEIRYHDYVHPTYPQCQPGFEPFMAALDLLLNCGPDSLAVLCEGQETLA